ncbi:MAG: beta-N-acetylhexosaminidase, partial [Bacteroidales bacterium]|nr:beta-N-acetylhexosaminidase [Bacteroidales bacterium]
MKIKYLLTIMAVSAILISCETKQKVLPAIIPLPVQIEVAGGAFILQPSTRINYTGGNEAAAVAEHLAGLLRPVTGFALKASEGNGGDIRLLIDTSGVWKPEEYRLTVKKRNVTLTAATPDGLFRGVQTIRQLLPPQIESSILVSDVKWTMPCVSVTDYPRFEWRGMHLDVSRHFFDVEFIKRYIDILALHKLNVFHWHLVDDQGWRIEIKKYPRLTETGAWRVDREDRPWNAREPQQPGEKATYGGFYTQEEIKEIVAYAAERYITVVPEIEMPAHVGSALAAYPEYSCTGGPFTVPPGGVWPITDIYCAGKEETFTFLEDVLTEVIELFPSQYIHIGGDEADKTEWRRCPECQARIRKEGLGDEDELQSYFIKRIEQFLISKGRKLIGWDEILQGGLAPEATVMSWQGFEGGITAARSGHHAVMTPVSHCYFNVYQGDPA